MKTLILLCGLLLTVPGCKPAVSTPPAAAATNQTFSVRGIIQQLSPDHRHVTIKHEKIPGYMAAMTMDFSVRDTNALAGFAPGDEITFALVVTGDDDWIENLQRTGKTGGVSGPPGWRAVEPELSVGDPLPDYEFTSENGRPVNFSDFHGRAVAFTFFFTSCPLPEYCPRLSKNFQETQEKLRAMSNAPANWHLLSVSFDSEFDSPPMLKAYGESYHYDPAHWSFLTGPPDKIGELARQAGVTYESDGNTINHNFCTLIVDTSGHLQTMFPVNGDFSDAIVSEIIKAAAVTNRPASLNGRNAQL